MPPENQTLQPSALPLFLERTHAAYDLKIIFAREIAEKAICFRRYLVDVAIHEYRLVAAIVAGADIGGIAHFSGRAELLGCADTGKGAGQAICPVARTEFGSRRRHSQNDEGLVVCLAHVACLEKLY